MDNLPSKSLSKSILIAAPLFILVLAILHASNEISYLFILKYVNNVAGKADMTFVPTMQPENNNPNFNEIKIKRMNDIIPYDWAQKINFNLVNLQSLKKWASSQSLVRGFSPRWLIPSETEGTDSLLFFIDLQKQKQIGLADNSKFKNIKKNFVALSQQLALSLKKKVGDKITTSFKISNILSGAKLLEKYRGQGSKKEQQSTFSSDFNQQKMAQNLAKQFNITKERAEQILSAFMKAEVPLNYQIKEIFEPNGLYPSILHNVIVIDYSEITTLMADFLVAEIKAGTFDSFIPEQYQSAWLLLKYTPQLSKRVQQALKQYNDNFALMAVASLQNRIDVYHPDQPIKSQFSQTLQSTPNNMDVIALYPLYELSLKLKFFFQSILQIFEFVSCLIFFHTMSLIMKQLYEEKQIEVGLWRTLGAGGIRSMNRQIQGGKNQSLIEKATWKDELFFGWFLICKVGYFYYWLFSVSVSMLLYIGYKYLFFSLVCGILKQQQISQSILLPILVFLGVFLFVQGLAINHVNKILTNPLVQTIKPVKRTYDLVKVRLLNLSTFGISSDTMLIAIMLTYYGVVAYYFIPYNILMDNESAQIYLFNSIFLFMILGAVMLVSVLQSKIQILILKIFFLLSSRFRKMKIIMIKNIRAKQYKNIKVCVIVALTFAFLLFFSSGVKIEIKIIQSFIERALGSDIVLENFQQNTFNRSKIDNLLNQKQIPHAWLSKDINRQYIEFKFLNHMAPKVDIRFQIKILSPQFLNCTYYKYYVPYEYANDIEYSQLPNGQYNGFDGIYYPNNGSSRGRYDPLTSINSTDPYGLNIKSYNFENLQKTMPNQQIINVALSRFAQQLLGVKAGSIYKLRVSNHFHRISFYTRARIVHSLKASPAFDILGLDAFISEEQIKYILENLKADLNVFMKFQRLLFLKSGTKPERVKGIGEEIVRKSPQHTQLFDIDNVKYTFELLITYLDGFVIIITTIMATLNIFFIAVYTVGKCRDEAQMFKMLRAIGLHISDIRWMIFLQILIRLIVAIINGIILGIILSQGFALQIQQILLFRVPSLDLTNIMIIGGILLFVFGISVNLSTRYLGKRNVLNTTKL